MTKENLVNLTENQRAILEVHNLINQPAKIDRVWVTYPRAQIIVVPNFLEQIMLKDYCFTKDTDQDQIQSEEP